VTDQSFAELTHGNAHINEHDNMETEGYTMRPIHWFVLIVILVLLFGASKLPELAHSLGESAKILKHELKDLQSEDGGSQTAPAAAPVTQPVMADATDGSASGRQRVSGTSSPSEGMKQPDSAPAHDEGSHGGVGGA
jgi:sec-independent protein translocase protein TatA